MEIALVILVGLCFGSFVTMASYRLPLELSIISPGSQCPKCKTALKARDLMPVLSWLMATAKCRYCKAPVSWRYPLTEIIMAAMFSVVYLHSGLTPVAVVLALFSAALLILIVADFETKLIPDELHLFLLPLGVMYHWLVGTPWLSVVGCTLFAGGIGLLLHYGYYWLRGRHGLGFGDVKFLFVCGLWIASLNQLSAFIFLAGALGVVTGIGWKFVSKDPRFPFGPSLALSLYLLTLWPSLSTYFTAMLQRLLT